MEFIAKGIISAQTKLGDGGRNTVEVEGNRYWISGMDMARVAEAHNIPLDWRFDQMPEIEGKEVIVKIHRDETGCWAELANQPTWCPLIYT